MPPVLINYVLFVSDSDVDEREVLDQCTNQQIKVLSSPQQGADTPGVLIKRESITDRPLPPEDALAYFSRGFSEADVDRLKGSKIAISVLGVGPFDPEHRLLIDLTQTVGRMAKRLNAYVFDAADSLTFTPEAFHSIRVAETERGELSAAQFGVRAYRVEGGVRSVTMGLEKFGQTNLGIALFSEHHMGAIDSMMTLAMQHVIESPSIVEPGVLELNIHEIRNPSAKASLLESVSETGSGKATLQLQPLQPTGGDPESLLAPTFRSRQGESLWAEQEAILVQLFGAARNVSEGVSMEDIEEAVEQARNKAVAILNDKKKWTVAPRRFRVAVSLPETREIVWVEVNSWRFGRGKGILLSEPNAGNLHSGSTFKFNASMIMDYTLADAENIIEAGGIDEIVQKMQSQ